MITKQVKMQGAIVERVVNLTVFDGQKSETMHRIFEGDMTLVGDDPWP